MAQGVSRSARAGLPVFAMLTGALVLAACATVKVQAPDKPIEINLNVKIDQEVRVKLDKEVQDLISKNPDVF